MSLLDKLVLIHSGDYILDGQQPCLDMAATVALRLPWSWAVVDADPDDFHPEPEPDYNGYVWIKAGDQIWLDERLDYYTIAGRDQDGYYWWRVDVDPDDFNDYGNLVLIHTVDAIGRFEERWIDNAVTRAVLGNSLTGTEADHWWVTTFDPADFHPVYRFEVGDRVRGDYDRLPVGARFETLGGYNEVEVLGGGRFAYTGYIDTPFRLNEADYKISRKITYLP